MDIALVSACAESAAFLLWSAAVIQTIRSPELTGDDWTVALQSDAYRPAKPARPSKARLQAHVPSVASTAVDQMLDSSPRSSRAYANERGDLDEIPAMDPTTYPSEKLRGRQPGLGTGRAVTYLEPDGYVEIGGLTVFVVADRHYRPGQPVATIKEPPRGNQS